MKSWNIAIIKLILASCLILSNDISLSFLSYCWHEFILRLKNFQMSIKNIDNLFFCLSHVRNTFHQGLKLCFIAYSLQKEAEIEWYYQSEINPKVFFYWRKERLYDVTSRKYQHQPQRFNTSSLRQLFYFSESGPHISIFDDCEQKIEGTAYSNWGASSSTETKNWSNNN